MKMKRREGNESKVERESVKIRRVRITMKMKWGEGNESKLERDRVKIRMRIMMKMKRGGG